MEATDRPSPGSACNAAEMLAAESLLLQGAPKRASAPLRPVAKHLHDRQDCQKLYRVLAALCYVASDWHMQYNICSRSAVPGADSVLPGLDREDATGPT